MLAVLLILILTTAPAPAEPAPLPDVVVIVHPSNPPSSISRDQLARLWLYGGRWQNGHLIQPVDLPPGSEIRRAFTIRILRRTVRSVEAHWQQHEDRRPHLATTDAEVVEHVRGHPGAIGYVSEGTPVEGVRILPVTQR